MTGAHFEISIDGKPRLLPRLHDLWLATGTDPCHICDVAKKSPHPYRLEIRPCIEHAGRFRWHILESDKLADTSWDSFATEREAKESGRREMKNLVEMWNKL